MLKLYKNLVFSLRNAGYKFKCWAWCRYTTVKPRNLPHTWCDRTELLSHVMFEVLSEFIEKECNPGHVEWHDPEWSHKITVNGVERYVMDEMKALYDWWNKKYLKAYPEFIDSLYDLISDEPIKFINSDDGYSTMEFNPVDSKVYDFINRVEEHIEKELEEKLIRLVKIRESMWT